MFYGAYTQPALISAPRSRSEHGYYLYLIRGSARVAGYELHEGDGLGMDSSFDEKIEALPDTEILLFHLATPLDSASRQHP